MAPGSFDISMVPETPQSVIDIYRKDDLYFYDHIVITEVALAPGVTLSDATVLPNARYTGRLDRISESGLTLSGQNLLVWLGSTDRKGSIPQAPVSVNGNLDAWLTALLASPCPIRKGTVTEPSPPTTFSGTFYYETRRTIIEWLMRYFGTEFGIDPTDATLDAGPEASLFTTTPDVIVTRASRSAEPLLRGLTTERMVKESGIENYATQVIALGGGDVGNLPVEVADISPATAFRNFFGDLVADTLIVDAPQIDGAYLEPVAETELAKATLEEAIDLDTDTYSIPNYVRPGDTIYVWDPERDILDTANQVHYRGELVFPKKLRVYAYSWPIEQGMGVYFRRHTSSASDWDWFDLSQWVAWETSAVSAQQVRPGDSPEALTVGDIIDIAPGPSGNGEVLFPF